MSGRFPPLNKSQVESILKKLGFAPKNSSGSHTQWEGYVNGQRRIVTVDSYSTKNPTYGKRILKFMINQSGLTEKEFYSYL